MQRVPDLELINAIRHASSDMEALRILKEHYPTTHKSIEEIERIVEEFDLACSEKISEDQDGTITTRRGLPNHILDKLHTTLTTYLTNTIPKDYHDKTIELLLEIVEDVKNIDKEDVWTTHELKEEFSKLLTTYGNARELEGAEKIEKAMFTKIKNDITKLQYDTDGDTFKKIVLSRLSSPEWFEAITSNKE
jgi:hypothetical protein